ncbi:tyrosyl-tRNA synthetase [Meira miltonrushii]|uniref:Tyrosine--tRNA ligase n=1 Tax=Meira miltonrushii TaxID=1280837 RepID=A0A316VDZ6_9BASI|nr:tyrosyl-tRNA synthetase [Meira miltonrushii]PWN35288.1 tyrosyl-tRNA synthetase [Meira miltonrushii]
MSFVSLRQAAFTFGRQRSIGARLRLPIRTVQSRQLSSHNVLDTLEERGLLHQVTAPNSLRTHLNDPQSPRSIYVGVDPSADSLHVGNLLPLLAALHFVRHGHKAVILIGGATGSIGDPSGRSTERQSLSIEALNHNVNRITQQVQQFFQKAREYGNTHHLKDLSDKSLEDRISVVNNATWYEGVGILDFLREVGKHARITSMLARDSVKSRLQPDKDGHRQDGLSFTEFSYQLLQAYDFSVLHRQPWGCTVQLGGSDQMGNIMAGVDLIRRQKALTTSESEVNIEEDDIAKDQQLPAYGLTLPLLTTASGAKFGKSAGNAVWLDVEKCSHYDFFQYFYRARDDEVGLYLKTLTLLPLEKVQSILNAHDQDKSKRLAQRALAEHLTELIRGSKALQDAQVATKVLFETELSGLTTEMVCNAFANDERLKTIKSEEVMGIDLSRLLSQIGLIKTRSEAKRAIANGGVYINNIPIRDQSQTLSPSDCIQGTNIVILRFGRTQHAILQIVD